MFLAVYFDFEVAVAISIIMSVYQNVAVRAPKKEIRISKSRTNSNVQNPNTFWSFEFDVFIRLGFRISCFEFWPILFCHAQQSLLAFLNRRPIDQLDVRADDFDEVGAVTGFDAFAAARGDVVFHLAER